MKDSERSWKKGVITKKKEIGFFFKVAEPKVIKKCKSMKGKRKKRNGK